VLGGENKNTKKTTGRAVNKEQLFQDFLVDMFASEKPLVNRISFDRIDNSRDEFGTDKKEKTTLYDQIL